MKKDLHPVFREMASHDQDAMERYMKVSAIRAVRKAFEQPLQQTDPYNIYDVVAQGYALLDDPKELDISDRVLGLLQGKQMLTPGVKKELLQDIYDLLSIQEANLFVDATRGGHAARQSGNRAVSVQKRT